MVIDSELLKPQTAATILRVKVGTLAAWRSKGIGAEFVRLNRSIRYPCSSLAAFVRSGAAPAARLETGA
jgi:hypothetical protein